MSTAAANRRPARRLLAATALLVACLGLPPGALAVLILTADGTGNTTAPPDDPGWANVGVRGIGNGVYLGGGWVLTVAHVGAGDIVLAGTSYTAAAGSAVQLTNAGAAGRSTTTDLVLYRLTTTPAGLAPVTIAATPPAAGTAVTMIGSGLDRGAFTEWSVNEATTPWTWTEVGSGGSAAGYRTASTRQMRWGTNTVSANELWVRATDLNPPLDVKSIETLFDAPFGTSEAQAVNHDSGGAVFAKNGGAWELAGMIFDVGGYSGQPSPAFNAVIGNATFSADLASYRPQIMAIVPEPPTVAPAVAALAALAGCSTAARRFRRLFPRSACLAALLGAAGGAIAGDFGPVHFARDVAPVLVRRCLECHSGESPEAGLTLTDEAGLRRGGESGAVIAPGDSRASLLWRRVAADEMPPKHPLSAADKRALTAWIDAGAAWHGGPLDPFSVTSETRAGRDFWSFAPLTAAVTPTDLPAGSAPPDWVRGPIDAFVLAQLARAGLRPAAPADPRALVRRLSFDLVGLPPTPEQIEAFAADPSDAAYGRLVDALLASPAYGERWGRHWLDVVRFGESDGFERNFARDHAWPYRDWVIDALNADLPYDRFVRMQLVGDLDGTAEGVAATGFWVAGAHNTVVGGSERMKLLARVDEVEEVLGTLGQTFVGLSLQCARCHDHKFDPVSQAEYYRLASAISGLGRGERTVPPPAVTAADPAAARPAAGAALAPRKIYALVPRGGEVTTLLARGDPERPGRPVTPGATAAVPGLAADFDLAADAPEAERRRKLADWIVHPDNPLFARVIVNRVWHHHFGTGLVDTPSDFGFNGGRPTHPELLDHLAADFRRHGQSLKRLHRQIVASTAYRQSSRPADADPRGPVIDAGNRLLWHGPRRRLEAESLRDAMLAVSGALDPARGGPGYRDVAMKYVDGTTFYEPLRPEPEFFRRTVYRFSPRGDRPPLLDTFDCPDPSVTAPRRSVTTTPLQALALLNDDLVLVLAEAFANRLRREAGDAPAAQVIRGWRLALGRSPDAEELGLAEALAARHGLAAVCRGLFNVGEFVSID